MSDNVRNGSRVAVVSPVFTGMAGVQGDTLAFIPTNKGKQLVPGSVITVDGEEREVRFVSKSRYVKDMVLVTLQS